MWRTGILDSWKPFGWKNLDSDEEDVREWCQIENTPSSSPLSVIFGWRCQWMLPNWKYAFSFPLSVIFGYIVDIDEKKRSNKDMEPWLLCIILWSMCARDMNYIFIPAFRILSYVSFTKGEFLCIYTFIETNELNWSWTHFYAAPVLLISFLFLSLFVYPNVVM